MPVYLVADGATLACTDGTAKSRLVVAPRSYANEESTLASVEDSVPMLNIMPFGECNATSNPLVMAATVQAHGVHTPAPCVPNITMKWAPGAEFIFQNLDGGRQAAALTSNSKCPCIWGGVVSITNSKTNLRVE